MKNTDNRAQGTHRRIARLHFTTLKLPPASRSYPDYIGSRNRSGNIALRKFKGRLIQ